MGAPLCYIATLTMSVTVVASRLLAPQNVHLTSYNMNLFLRWSPPENESRELLYWTQLWTGHRSQPRSACINTTALHCELTDPSLGLHIFEFGSYHASVRAHFGDEQSEWVKSSGLDMDKDTVIGPPTVSLESNGADLEVIMTEPKFHISKMTDTFGLTHYNISYWPRGRPDMLSHELVQQNRAVLNDLEPLTEYCVQVRVQLDPVKNHSPAEASEPVCTSTNKKPSDPWLAAVLTFVFLAVAATLVVVAVVYRERIGHFLCPNDPLPQLLTETPHSLCHLMTETEVCHPLSVTPAHNTHHHSRETPTSEELQFTAEPQT